MLNRKRVVLPARERNIARGTVSLEQVDLRKIILIPKIFSLDIFPNIPRVIRHQQNDGENDS